MDALIRESQEHGTIREKMTFFKNALPLIRMNKDHDQVVALSKFINRNIVAHFRYEEVEIFPVLVQNGDAEIKKIVANLLDDHAQIRVLVEKFFSLSDDIDSKSGPSYFDEINAIVKEIFAKTLVHAEFEDNNLFPVIKIMSKFFSEDLLPR